MMKQVLRSDFLLAIVILLAIASCKPAENKSAPETQETSAGDANAANDAKDFGPTLLKIATQYWIDFHETYNSLLNGPGGGFIDLNGKVVIESKPEWKEVRDFSEGIALVKQDGRWGWLDKNGRLVEPILDDFPHFHEGFAGFTRAGKRGFIDTKGAVVIQPEWDEVGQFSGGYAGVKRNGKWGGIDKTGRLITPLGKYEQLDFVPALGLWLIKREGKWGYIDKAGRVVIKPQWEDGGCDWKEGLAVVIQNGKFGFVDKTGRIVIPAEGNMAASFSEGLAGVLRDGTFTFFDRTGRVVIGPQPGAALEFNGGVATVVTQDGKFGAIDKTGKVVIEPQWDEMPWTFQRGLTPVKKDKKWGFIDRTGRVVIEPQWDIAQSYQETEDKNAPVYWLVAREEKKPEPSSGASAENQPRSWFLKAQNKPIVRVQWLDSAGKQIWSSDNSNSPTGK